MADENSINHILARLSSVEAAAAKISSLEARVEVMDDDIPEPQKRWVAEDDSSSGSWNGKVVDFYGTTILSIDVSDPEEILGKYICYHTGLSPTKHASGVWPKDVSSGAWYWDTEVRGSPWMSWEVGGDEIKDENGDSYTPKQYALAVGKTVGTIRITVPIPNAAYKVIQLGAGTGTSTTDNGVLAQYSRTH